MKRNKYERAMIEFLQKYPNVWHSFHDDAVTIRTLAVLHLLHNVKVDMDTLQMKLEILK